MKTSDTAELTRAILDAHSIANLLDRLTPEESAITSDELRLLRAHTWALVDGLQPLAAEQPMRRANAPAAASVLGPGVARNAPARQGTP